eukprot:7234932-Pyramimonas_sp.AAC.1
MGLEIGAKVLLRSGKYERVGVLVASDLEEQIDRVRQAKYMAPHQVHLGAQVSRVEVEARGESRVLPDSELTRWICRWLSMRAERGVAMAVGAFSTLPLARTIQMRISAIFEIGAWLFAVASIAALTHLQGPLQPFMRVLTIKSMGSPRQDGLSRTRTCLVAKLDQILKHTTGYLGSCRRSQGRRKTTAILDVVRHLLMQEALQAPCPPPTSIRRICGNPQMK